MYGYVCIDMYMKSIFISDSCVLQKLAYIESLFLEKIQGSVQFSRSVVSDSLRPHEPQHTRPPCPSPTPRVHPNPSPSS